MTGTEKQGYINAISAARTGPALRKPISEALRAFWNDSKYAETLGRKRADYFVPQEYFNTRSKVDSAPTFNSGHLVSSGGVFAAVGDLENIELGGI